MVDPSSAKRPSSPVCSTNSNLGSPPPTTTPDDTHATDTYVPSPTPARSPSDTRRADLLPRPTPSESKSHPPHTTTTGFLAGGAIGLAATVAAQYYGSAYTSAAARSIYNSLYTLIHGKPSWYTPRYWLHYLPMREYVSSLAYRYGPQAVSLAVALTRWIWSATAPHSAANALDTPS